MYVTAIRRVGGLWPRQPYHVFVLIHLVPDMHIVFKVQYEIKYRLRSNTITIVQQPSRHFYLNLAKIPPNQVIADFGR